MAAALTGSIAKKYYSVINKSGVIGSFTFNAVCCFAAALVLLCWGGFGIWWAVLLSLVFVDIFGMFLFKKVDFTKSLAKKS